MKEEVVELTKQLVSIPTVTGNEGRIVDFLEGELREAGMEVRRQFIKKAGFNLLASRGRGGPLFVTHLDVFPPYHHPAPFEPRVEGDEIIGRGAIDAKGQITALLFALKQTDEPAEVALLVDEERQGRGSEGMEVPEGSEYALVLEPTNLEICISQAGSIEVEIEVEGKSAHGSVPWEGENAIDKALSIYRRLKNLPLLSVKHPLFPRGGWVTLGRIEGGYEPMVVPERCFMHVDIGFVPGVSPQEAERQVRGATEGAKSLTILDLWEGFEVGVELKMARVLEEAFQRALSRKPLISGMPSWTDAANLSRKGLKPVIFGVGKLPSAHSSREALPIPQLMDMICILSEFIRLWKD